MTVPARIKRDPAISTTRKAVLVAIDSHVGSKGHPLRQKTIAKELGVSTRTVMRAVTWLVAEGYLVAVKRHGQGGARLSNHYILGPRCRDPRDTSVTTPLTPVSQQEEQPLEEQPSEGPPLDAQLTEHQVAKEKRPVDLSTQSDARETTTDMLKQYQVELRHLKSRPDRHPGALLTVGAESARSTVLQNRGAPHHDDARPHIPTHDRMTAMERVVDRLDRVQRNGTTTLASCPVPSHGKGNGDRNPSLSIAEREGRVLIHCMSECNPQDVLIELGLDWPDLYDEPITNERGTKECEWTYQARDGSPWLTVERWQTPQGKRFVQRVPGAPTAGLPSTFKPCLFKLPKVLAAAAAGEEVYIVEGEKCVAAAEKLGVVATTAPAGVNGWRDYYTKWLVGCSQVTIVCDNDEPGMRYAAGVAASLRGAGIKVRTMKVAVPDAKADLYDHVLAGHGIAELVPVRLNPFRPEGSLAGPLLARVFPPVEWVIRDLMPIGFSVLGGSPKVGKSFIVLDAALNVALGGDFLHTQRCERGSVLYLSMDNDAEWRLQLRLRHLQMQYGVSLADVDIEFHTDFPTGDGAIKGIEEWCAEQREDGKRPLLVVADTLQKIEPNFDGSANRSSMNGGYGQATTNLSKWSQLALDQRVGVLATHHIRKSGDEDWMNRFIGSQGIAATATTLMMVDHQRGTKEARLMVSSRDAGEHELQMLREGWSWQLIEPARAEQMVTTKVGLRVLPGGQS